MKGGPEDYIGAVVCLRGTLYFKGAHTRLVRKRLRITPCALNSKKLCVRFSTYQKQRKFRALKERLGSRRYAPMANLMLPVIESFRDRESVDP